MAEDIEQLEKSIEARVELKYLRREVTELSKALKEHMDKEEQERADLMKKLNLLTYLVLGAGAGIPGIEILKSLI